MSIRALGCRFVDPTKARAPITKAPVSGKVCQFNLDGCLSAVCAPLWLGGAAEFVAGLADLALEYNMRQYEGGHTLYGPWLNLYYPKGLDRPVLAIVFVHGGYWSAGDKDQFYGYGMLFAQQGYVTVFPEYRLSGEAEFPAEQLDCRSRFSEPPSNTLNSSQQFFDFRTSNHHVMHFIWSIGEP